jgi:hypothetical protein
MFRRNILSPILVEDQEKHRYGYREGGTRTGVLSGPIGDAERDRGQSNGNLPFNSPKGRFPRFFI